MITVIADGALFKRSYRTNFNALSGVGEYRVNFKAIMKCNLPTDIDFGHNFYLSKISSNTTELRGNLTLNRPMSDNLTVHMNMAIKDSIGGWKDNAHLLKSPKACSTVKSILGTEWPLYLKSFGINNFNCPIAPGVYVSKGYDLTNAVLRSNFPKTFFYGTYKTRFHFTDQLNNEFGCSIFVIEVKRPWEIE
ncbi:uncharacterized protein LOC132928778 isoform X1 [Rhopalosiphum padi]|uniref:uncharacterized protein LOC132928778 isoform X1 n=1 Tax=Rhopalosiphum padi TaxID=40932 RepID=UPI00298E5B93|nr:uncharacterized protein LOC132928778 isoform X1 [Rhopalosiphum padi]